VVEGKGAILRDSRGREYIDCMGAYGVSIIGHCHPRVVEAIKRQSEKLIACHGSLYNEERAKLVKKLIDVAPHGLEKVYLCNSGAEAIECALKVASKYTGRKIFVSMVGGYHGKTLGALSATWNPKCRRAFNHLLYPNFKFVPYGNFQKAEEAISDEVAAVLVEPIQGESGIKIPPEGFLQHLRKLCDKHGSLLIMDEIQTGLGRTGRMWASQHWGITPDIMCVAKGIAGGIPMGVTLARAEIMDSLKIGEHTTTFGGNPLACAAACATLEVIIEERLADRAWRLGGEFKRKLLEIQSNSRIVREVRGLGLMIGIELRFDVYNILMKALDKSVILLYSGKNVIRLLPPLVIEEEQLEKIAEVLEELLREEERERIGK